MKRRESKWWPVSSARARKLSKKGVLCHWHWNFGSLVRRNPMTNESTMQGEE